MSRRAKTKRYANKMVVSIGLFIIIAIALLGASYLVLGMPVWNAERINTASVQALTASGADANATNVNADGDTLEFTLGAAAAIIKIPLKDDWKDLKGSFTGVSVDLSDCEYAATWELAKVYLSDGSTDIYIGSIKESEKKAILTVDPEDTENMDDFQPVWIIIKFYDSSGNLVDCLASGTEQSIKLYGSIKADTSTVAGFLTSIALACIVALRKVITALTSAMTSFLLAITTNSALLTIFGALIIVVGWFMLTEKRFRIK